jgi:carboxymethylenebutenolidase
MERKTAQDFDPEVLILFDAYVHGAIDRRGFLDRASKFAVGGMTAPMLLEALSLISSVVSRWPRTISG